MARTEAPSPLVAWILYAALWASTVVYLVVLKLSEPPAGEAPTPDPTTLIGIGIAAVGCAVVSFVLPRHLHRKALAAATLEVKEIPDPDASVMFRDQTPTIRVFADPEAARRRARAIFFTPFILRLALAEAVAIYGFVLKMLGFDWVVLAPFYLVCWSIFAVSSPRASWIYGPLEAAFDARLVEGA